MFSIKQNMHFISRILSSVFPTDVCRLISLSDDGPICHIFTTEVKCVEVVN